MTQRKLAHITAIHSNPNYDQKEVNKDQIIQNMEQRFEQALDSLYISEEVEKKVEEDAFLSAGKRGLEWTKKYEKSGKVLEEANKEEMDIDQM